MWQHLYRAVGWLTLPWDAFITSRLQLDAGPTRKGLKRLLQALCSLKVGQGSFGESLLHTFWGQFSSISEHWSQARGSQNITKQKISLL